MSKFKADYRCLLGDIRQNAMIRAADLGMNGIYEPSVYTVTWEEGTVVDQERAEKVCQVLKEAFKKQGVDCGGVILEKLYVDLANPKEHGNKSTSWTT